MFCLIVQTLESELGVRVAALLQQRAALSVENYKLKQQVARLQQEKLAMERKLLCISSLTPKSSQKLKDGLKKSNVI